MISALVSPRLSASCSTRLRTSRSSAFLALRRSGSPAWDPAAGAKTTATSASARHARLLFDSIDSPCRPCAGARLEGANRLPVDSAYRRAGLVRRTSWHGRLGPANHLSGVIRGLPAHPFVSRTQESGAQLSSDGVGAEAWMQGPTLGSRRAPRP